MRQIALILAFALSIALPARADTIPRVIEQQIEALQADDFARAFTFASPNIKRMFGTPERFGQMVREGYPMVYRPSEVRMLEQQNAHGMTFQRVMLRDGSGQVHFLSYAMIETDEGWQINGVTILRAPGVGA